MGETQDSREGQLKVKRLLALWDTCHDFKGARATGAGLAHLIIDRYIKKDIDDTTKEVISFIEKISIEKFVKLNNELRLGSINTPNFLYNVTHKTLIDVILKISSWKKPSMYTSIENGILDVISILHCLMTELPLSTHVMYYETSKDKELKKENSKKALNNLIDTLFDVNDENVSIAYIVDTSKIKNVVLCEVPNSKSEIHVTQAMIYDKDGYVPITDQVKRQKIGGAPKRPRNENGDGDGGETVGLDEDETVSDDAPCIIYQPYTAKLESIQNEIISFLTNISIDARTQDKQVGIEYLNSNREVQKANVLVTSEGRSGVPGFSKVILEINDPKTIDNSIFHVKKRLFLSSEQPFGNNDYYTKDDKIKYIFDMKRAGDWLQAKTSTVDDESRKRRMFLTNDLSAAAYALLESKTTPTTPIIITNKIETENMYYIKSLGAVFDERAMMRSIKSLMIDIKHDEALLRLYQKVSIEINQSSSDSDSLWQQLDECLTMTSSLKQAFCGQQITLPQLYKGFSEQNKSILENNTDLKVSLFANAVVMELLLFIEVSILKLVNVVNYGTLTLDEVINPWIQEDYLFDTEVDVTKKYIKIQKLYFRIKTEIADAGLHISFIKVFVDSTLRQQVIDSITGVLRTLEVIIERGIPAHEWSHIIEPLESLEGLHVNIYGVYKTSMENIRKWNFLSQKIQTRKPRGSDSRDIYRYFGAQPEKDYFKLLKFYETTLQNQTALAREINSLRQLITLNGNSVLEGVNSEEIRKIEGIIHKFDIEKLDKSRQKKDENHLLSTLRVLNKQIDKIQNPLRKSKRALAFTKGSVLGLQDLQKIIKLRKSNILSKHQTFLKKLQTVLDTQDDSKKVKWDIAYLLDVMKKHFAAEIHGGGGDDSVNIQTTIEYDLDIVFKRISDLLDESTDLISDDALQLCILIANLVFNEKYEQNALMEDYMDLYDNDLPGYATNEELGAFITHNKRQPISESVQVPSSTSETISIALEDFDPILDEPFFMLSESATIVGDSVSFSINSVDYMCNMFDYTSVLKDAMNDDDYVTYDELVRMFSENSAIAQVGEDGIIVNEEATDVATPTGVEVAGDILDDQSFKETVDEETLRERNKRKRNEMTYGLTSSDEGREQRPRHLNESQMSTSEIHNNNNDLHESQMSSDDSASTQQKDINNNYQLGGTIPVMRVYGGGSKVSSILSFMNKPITLEIPIVDPKVLARRIYKKINEPVSCTFM